MVIVLVVVVVAVACIGVAVAIGAVVSMLVEVEHCTSVCCSWLIRRQGSMISDCAGCLSHGSRLQGLALKGSEVSSFRQPDQGHRERHRPMYSEYEKPFGKCSPVAY